VLGKGSQLVYCSANQKVGYGVQEGDGGVCTSLEEESKCYVVTALGKRGYKDIRKRKKKSSDHSVCSGGLLELALIIR